MKNRLFLQFSLLALVIGAFVVNGCKDTATDPSYVALAEIRFANYHQVQPIQIFIYPQNASAADSISKTPTAMTYGIVTPYFNNLPTNRTAGEIYHLVAKIAGTPTVVASDFVTLFPGDKKTWLISGDNGTFDHTLIDDGHTAVNDTTHAFYRFLNVDPDHPQGLTLMVGDPLNGMPLAVAQAYKTASPYVPIPIPFAGTPPVAVDSAVTFYVVDPATGTVLSRLAGVGLSAGTYHTLTWGGATIRIPDPTTGNLTQNDTIRIRILDDDPGTDLTLTPPLTFRYNIINALLPPSVHDNLNRYIDYTPGGLDIIINNNTLYDYQHIQPFQPVPWYGNFDPNNSNVFSSVPATTPLVDLIYVKMVKPFFGGNAPSQSDTILFRFLAGAGSAGIKSDQLYSIVVFDTVQNKTPKSTDGDFGIPYDSAGGTFTVLIPDIPIKDSGRIVLGYMLAKPPKGLPLTSNNAAKISVNGVVQNTKNVINGKLGSVTKTVDPNQVVPAGVPVNLEAVSASGDMDVKFSFTPESGGIYEAMLVGQRGRTDAYGPRFVVVRVNPK